MIPDFIFQYSFSFILLNTSLKVFSNSPSLVRSDFSSNSIILIGFILSAAESSSFEANIHLLKSLYKKLYVLVFPVQVLL